MSEQTVSSPRPWVLVSVLKENTQEQDITRITPAIVELVDQWQSKGKIMWSGPFDDNKTGLAVFEATDDEAREFFDKYGKICSGVLDYYMYQWDAMPILSFL